MSNPYRTAKLTFLTNPFPGRYLLNVQFEGDDDSLIQVEISRGQLGNLLVDGTVLVCAALEDVTKEMV